MRIIIHPERNSGNTVSKIYKISIPGRLHVLADRNVHRQMHGRTQTHTHPHTEFRKSRTGFGLRGIGTTEGGRDGQEGVMNLK